MKMREFVEKVRLQPSKLETKLEILSRAKNIWRDKTFDKTNTEASLDLLFKGFETDAQRDEADFVIDEVLNGRR